MSSSALNASPEGLQEIGKKFNLLKGRDFRASVRRIQRHKILVVGSFIIGLDVDEPGIGARIAQAGFRYVVDNLNVLFLTPLPGTRLWGRMKADDRIALDKFPEDWKYYTLTFPVARYKHLFVDGIIEEMISCDRKFYFMPRILARVLRSAWQRRRPLISLVGNLSYRSNIRVEPGPTPISRASERTGTTEHAERIRKGLPNSLQGRTPVFLPQDIDKEMFHSLYREEIDHHGGEEEEGPEPICSERAVIVSRQKAVCSFRRKSIV